MRIKYHGFVLNSSAHALFTFCSIFEVSEDYLVALDRPVVAGHVALIFVAVLGECQLGNGGLEMAHKLVWMI